MLQTSEIDPDPLHFNAMGKAQCNGKALELDCGQFVPSTPKMKQQEMNKDFYYPKINLKCV